MQLFTQLILWCQPWRTNSREFTLSVAEDFEAKSLTVTERYDKVKGVRSLTYDGWAHLLHMSTNTSPINF